ncbi:MAG: ferrous iron transport protein B [Verrucomicrobiota bacterium]
MSATTSNATKPATPVYVALTGTPNCGKTTLFNALTGLRAKVGNYAGVTDERKEGKLRHTPPELDITVLDLPGTYSLSPKSLDEQISRDVLFHRLPDVPAPALVVVVIDASNLERNLYYATQVIELGYPTIIALNMVDVAKENGHEVDADKLSQRLGAPVVPMVASVGDGLTALCEAIFKMVRGGCVRPRPVRFSVLPKPLEHELAELAVEIEDRIKNRHTAATAEALLLLTDEKVSAESLHLPKEISERITAARKRLDFEQVDWRGGPIEARYATVGHIHKEVTTETMLYRETFSDKADHIITHKFWGLLIFIGIMALIFQSIFTFAEYPMTWLESGVAWGNDYVKGLMPPGDLQNLICDGVIAGVGAVVVFLPQICMLFLFIGLLEDSGYMARAAFLMDRLMSKVGLHGKSFIPMLSSYACAIPGIMATRTIENPKDRLATILIAPLMSCSARLPVYTLLIAACIPDKIIADLHYEVNLGFIKFNLFGFLGLPGLTMLGMYLLGTVSAFVMAWVLKRTLLKGEPPLLIMELPPYKRPVFSVTIRHVWDRSKMFLARAGTVILGISILLWFLSTYPRSAEKAAAFEAQRGAVATMVFAEAKTDEAIAAAREAKLKEIDETEKGESLRYSFAGRLGHMIEPAIKPLGMDWKIGIGLVASFAAREVFVSTMSTVYNVETDDTEEGTKKLAKILQSQTRDDGTKLYTALLGLTLMVFYVYALQCVSTVAVVYRETGGWKWATFQLAYMGALAWGAAFIVYQGGRMLGYQ